MSDRTEALFLLAVGCAVLAPSRVWICRHIRSERGRRIVLRGTVALAFGCAAAFFCSMLVDLTA
jgi:hypothetical protein